MHSLLNYSIYVPANRTIPASRRLRSNTHKNIDFRLRPPVMLSIHRELSASLATVADICFQDGFGSHVGQGHAIMDVTLHLLNNLFHGR